MQTLLPRDMNAENDGRYIEVDLNRLIESVYLAPKTRDCFRDLVEATAIKYASPAKVEDSKLDEDAWF